MDKEGFIRILLYGRNKFPKYLSDCISTYKSSKKIYLIRSKISKEERVSCCYPVMYKYKGAVLEASHLRGHVQSEKHIRKLVEKLGTDDKRLRKELKFYSGKIMKGE